MCYQLVLLVAMVEKPTIEPRSSRSRPRSLRKISFSFFSLTTVRLSKVHHVDSPDRRKTAKHRNASPQKSKKRDMNDIIDRSRATNGTLMDSTDGQVSPE